MKINTLVEFIWNPDSNQYEEVYSESYNYKGELALADDMDDIIEQYGDVAPDQSGVPPTDPNYASSKWSPSLSDLLKMSSSDIMKGFGISEEDRDKYAMYAPEYDKFEEEYASGKQDLEESRLTSQIESLKGERDIATDMYDLGRSAIGRQQEQVLEQGQQGMYDIFRQSSSLASGGLGERRNISSSALMGAERTYKRGMQDVAQQSIEQGMKYKSQMGQIEKQIQGLQFGIEGSLLDEAYKTQRARSGYEEELYDFLMQLNQSFEVELG